VPKNTILREKRGCTKTTERTGFAGGVYDNAVNGIASGFEMLDIMKGKEGGRGRQKYLAKSGDLTFDLFKEKSLKNIQNGKKGFLVEGGVSYLENEP